MVVSGGKGGQGAEQAQVHTEPMNGAGNGTLALGPLAQEGLQSWMPLYIMFLVLAAAIVCQQWCVNHMFERELPRTGKTAAVKALMWQMSVQFLFGCASVAFWLAMRSGELDGSATVEDWLFVGYFTAGQLALAACTGIGACQSVATANKVRDASAERCLRNDGCSVFSGVSTESTSSSGSSSSSESGLLDAPKGKRHRKRRSMARAQRRRSRRPSFLPPLHYHTGGSSDESFSSRSKFLRRRDTGAPSAPSHLMQCPHSLSQGPPGPPLPYGWGGVYSGTQGNSYGAMPPLYGPPCPRTADEPKKNTQ